MSDFQIDPNHIIRSPYTECSIPDTDLYTFVFHREQVGNFPPEGPKDRIVFIDGPTGKKITFSDLHDRVKLLSRGFAQAMGIQCRDSVCFYMPNHMDYPTALWAAFRLGAVPSCANPIYTATELVHQLKLSKSKFILTHPGVVKSALDAAKQVGIPESRIFLVEKGKNLNGFLTVPELVESGKRAPEVAPLKLSPGESKERAALLNFSSGTSGLPKGVLISHSNVIANVCQIYNSEYASDTEGTISNGSLPFFHIYGLVAILHSSLVLRRTLVIQPAFTPESFVNDIHKYKITTLFVVPPILLALLHRVPHEKLKFNPPLRSICCAAAPLPKDIVPDLQKIWPTTLIRQGWGMTETATAVTLTPEGSPIDGYYHTCGPVLPNAEIVLVDTERKRSVAPGSGQGELWVRAPSVTLGYIDNPKETAGMFNIGGQGWLRSGDEAEVELGKTNVEGKIKDTWLLCIRDRLKELIKVSGNQVAPAELENVLASHPAVADQCVVGKPDDRKGEVPWAFIVKKSEVTKEDIMDWVKQRTSKYKHLGGVEFVDQIVKNPSGKILKRVYREWFKKQREGGSVKAKL